MKKNAIIFGGSGDLGSAIIQDFLEKGFELVITYKDKKLNNLKNKFRKYKKIKSNSIVAPMVASAYALRKFIQCASIQKNNFLVINLLLSKMV